MTVRSTYGLGAVPLKDTEWGQGASEGQGVSYSLTSNDSLSYLSDETESAVARQIIPLAGSFQKLLLAFRIKSKLITGANKALLELPTTLPFF